MRQIIELNSPGFDVQFLYTILSVNVILNGLWVVYYLLLNKHHNKGSAVFSGRIWKRAANKQSSADIYL